MVPRQLAEPWLTPLLPWVLAEAPMCWITPMPTASVICSIDFSKTSTLLMLLRSNAMGCPPLELQLPFQVPSVSPCPLVLLFLKTAQVTHFVRAGLDLYLMRDSSWITANQEQTSFPQIWNEINLFLIDLLHHSPFTKKDSLFSFSHGNQKHLTEQGLFSY